MIKKQDQKDLTKSFELNWNSKYKVDVFILNIYIIVFLSKNEISILIILWNLFRMGISSNVLTLTYQFCHIKVTDWTCVIYLQTTNVYLTIRLCKKKYLYHCFKMLFPLIFIVCFVSIQIFSLTLFHRHFKNWKVSVYQSFTL